MSFPTLTGDLSVQLRKITQLFMCHAPCGEEPFLRVSRWSVVSGMRSSWTPGASDSSGCNNQSCTSRVVILSHLLYLCYWTQVQLFTAQKPIIQEASVSRKEWCFNQKIHQSGEKVDSCLETDLEDSSEPWKDFKGENGELSQWVIEAWGWVQHESFFWCYLALVICLQSC